MSKTPQAIQHCHQLMLWIIPQIDKFPRARKFTLGEKIEQSLIDILRGLIEANYSPRGREKLLQKVNTELTVVRHYWRLAFKLGAIASKSYEFGSKQMVQLGQQVGGWQKQQNGAN
jgi:hypothetical protein